MDGWVGGRGGEGVRGLREVTSRGGAVEPARVITSTELLMAGLLRASSELQPTDTVGPDSSITVQFARMKKTGQNLNIREPFGFERFEAAIRRAAERTATNMNRPAAGTKLRFSVAHATGEVRYPRISSRPEPPRTPRASPLVEHPEKVNRLTRAPTRPPGRRRTRTIPRASSTSTPLRPEDGSAHASRSSRRSSSCASTTPRASTRSSSCRTSTRSPRRLSCTRACSLRARRRWTAPSCAASGT